MRSGTAKVSTLKCLCLGASFSNVYDLGLFVKVRGRFLLIEKAPDCALLLVVRTSVSTLTSSLDI